jgi:hypothetical protein
MLLGTASLTVYDDVAKITLTKILFNNFSTFTKIHTSSKIPGK